MASFFKALTDEQIAFIERQPMFFVATAAADGRINLSPKGLDSFRVFSPTACAFLNLTGSGNETDAHLKRDGRITVMFNSYEKKPLILRLYGRGRCAPRGSAAFEQSKSLFPANTGARQVVFIDIESVQTSCGFAVPEMKLVRQRPILTQWTEAKGPDGIADYWREKNMKSIDGFETALSEQVE
ncbi:pyridoxamine 5'-phosphate oxidase family protein [Hyphococcus luteus]|uniref:Pyridoxamine 5'-phosphate oxidase n=1 Tax=Hyphococcus luteus TaxID=2058213 RepID=A0A2S7K8V3_9PROT|nr:pyridoxamine 5'-phosphate oxidase family protein [Marinicaulis flavus]PQA88937.1 pyridoxamine 5'-phosphate oxidase [Marinicaulis flavus]